MPLQSLLNVIAAEVQVKALKAEKIEPTSWTVDFEDARDAMTLLQHLGVQPLMGKKVNVRCKEVSRTALDGGVCL